MTSVNFKFIGLTRPGFENREVQTLTHDLQIRRSPRTASRRFTHSATMNGFDNKRSRNKYSRSVQNGGRNDARDMLPCKYVRSTMLSLLE